MNVRLAVNVFSNTVSKALSFCGQNHVIDKYNWKNVSIVQTTVVLNWCFVKYMSTILFYGCTSLKIL